MGVKEKIERINIGDAVQKMRPLLGDLMTGNVLVNDKFQKQLPFVVFILMLSLFYVNNSFNYEAEWRAMNRLK